ncbi:alcohol dehydrogenase catalytic domain-containing protein [Chloroflexota bacterium]
MVVKEVSDPKLEKGVGVFKVKVCSICRADLRIYRYGHLGVKLPQTLGNEIAGVVEAVADEVTGCRVGMHVALCP